MVLNARWANDYPVLNTLSLHIHGRTNLFRHGTFLLWIYIGWVLLTLINLVVVVPFFCIVLAINKLKQFIRSLLKIINKFCFNRLEIHIKQLNYLGHRHINWFMEFRLRSVVLDNPYFKALPNNNSIVDKMQIWLLQHRFDIAKH